MKISDLSWRARKTLIVIGEWGQPITNERQFCERHPLLFYFQDNLRRVCGAKTKKELETWSNYAKYQKRWNADRNKRIRAMYAEDARRNKKLMGYAGRMTRHLDEIDLVLAGKAQSAIFSEQKKP